MREKRKHFRQTIHDAVMLFWRDIKDMKWAIMIVIAYFALGKNFLYSMCPLVVITGFPCPGCGLTRAGSRLLRFDLAGAYDIHPFIYPIVIYAGIWGWNRYIRKRKTGRGLKILLVILFVLMILFYIWRMWHYFPGEPPMSYYEWNLLRFIGNRPGRFR